MESLHSWKLTCPLKRDYFNRKYIFQPLIFRGHVSFPESIPKPTHLSPLTPASNRRFFSGKANLPIGRCFVANDELAEAAFFYKHLGGPPKIGGNPPKSSILIGVFLIFTIHFGGFPSIFGVPPIWSEPPTKDVSKSILYSGCLAFWKKKCLKEISLLMATKKKNLHSPLDKKNTNAKREWQMKYIFGIPIKPANFKILTRLEHHFLPLGVYCIPLMNSNPDLWEFTRKKLLLVLDLLGPKNLSRFPPNLNCYRHFWGEQMKIWNLTLPKTNIAPKNKPPPKGN